MRPRRQGIRRRPHQAAQHGRPASEAAAAAVRLGGGDEAAACGSGRAPQGKRQAAQQGAKRERAHASMDDALRAAAEACTQVALITGGDSSIGRAVAVACAREGCDVAICYRAHHEDAKETVQMVCDEGRDAIAIAGDASLQAFADEAVELTLRTFGKLDILVRCASSHKPLVALTRHARSTMWASRLCGTLCATSHPSSCTRRSRRMYSPCSTSRRRHCHTWRTKAPSSTVRIATLRLQPAVAKA